MMRPMNSDFTIEIDIDVYGHNVSVRLLDATDALVRFELHSACFEFDN